MKLLALLLLLANVVLIAAGFERRLNAPPPPRDLPAFEGRVRLQLVDELERLPPLRDAGVKRPPPAPPPPLFGPNGTLTAGIFAATGVPGVVAAPPAPPAAGTTYALGDDDTGAAATAVDPATLAAIDGSAPLEPAVAPGFEDGAALPGPAVPLAEMPAEGAAQSVADPVTDAADTTPAVAATDTPTAPVDAGAAPSAVVAATTGDAAAAPTTDTPATDTSAGSPDAAIALADAAPAAVGSAPADAAATTEPAATDALDTALATADAAADATATDEAATLAPAVCRRVGPFAAAPAADAFQRRLAERGVKHKRFVQDGEPRKLFWVYLEPPSKEEAQSQIDALAKAGVKDILLIKRGGIENAISLGVFSSQDSVNRRLAEMSERGYQPLVVPRYEPTKTHWIDIAAAADAQASAPDGVPAAPLDCASLGRAAAP